MRVCVCAPRLGADFQIFIFTSAKTARNYVSGRRRYVVVAWPGVLMIAPRPLSVDDGRKKKTYKGGFVGFDSWCRSERERKRAECARGRM